MTDAKHKAQELVLALWTSTYDEIAAHLNDGMHIEMGDYIRTGVHPTLQHWQSTLTFSVPYER